MIPLLGYSAMVAGSDSSTTLNLTNYKISFEDDFRTLNLSAHGPGTTWTTHTPWNGDFGDAAFVNPGEKDVFAHNAEGLTITATKGNDGKWYSGLICSVDRDGPAGKGFSQKYGYFEMMAKLPSGMGTWPAFWLIGTDKSQAASEIDVIEYYGGFPGYFHSTEHVWVNGAHRLLRTKLSKVPDGILSSQYNTFGVLITPATTSFYMNRQEIWRTPTPPEYRQPMYILANLALGGGWPVEALSSPQVMQIKYIRAYQLISGTP